MPVFFVFLSFSFSLWQVNRCFGVTLDGHVLSISLLVLFLPSSEVRPFFLVLPFTLSRVARQVLCAYVLYVSRGCDVCQVCRAALAC